MSKKILVVILDGAEYTLIDKWSELKHLRLKEYGFHSIPALNTTVLIPSFLSGIDPEDFPVPYRFPRNVAWAIPIKRLMPKKIVSLLKSEARLVPWYEKVDTIFNHAKKPIAVSIPMYSEGKTFSRETPIDPNKSKEELDRENLVEVIKIWDEIDTRIRNENWDFAMVHFGYLDLTQHFYYDSIEEVREAYRNIDSLIGDLQKHADINLVISDHGVIKGVHPPYGYYAISETLKLRQHYPDLAITDYYEILQHLMNDTELPYHETVREIGDIGEGETSASWKLRKTLLLLLRHGCIVRQATELLNDVVMDDILQRASESRRVKATNYLLQGWSWYDKNHYLDLHVEKGVLKPLLHWTNEDLNKYAEEHDLGVEYHIDFQQIVEQTKPYYWGEIR